MLTPDEIELLLEALDCLELDIPNQVPNLSPEQIAAMPFFLHQMFAQAQTEVEDGKLVKRRIIKLKAKLVDMEDTLTAKGLYDER